MEEQIKQEAKKRVEQMRGCSIILMQNSKGSPTSPFKSGYVAGYYTDVVFKECALKGIQNEIDLLDSLQEYDYQLSEKIVGKTLHLKQVKTEIESM
jgi:hypothetical protein